MRYAIRRDAVLGSGLRLGLLWWERARRRRSDGEVTLQLGEMVDQHLLFSAAWRMRMRFAGAEPIDESVESISRNLSRAYRCASRAQSPLEQQCDYIWYFTNY